MNHDLLKDLEQAGWSKLSIQWLSNQIKAAKRQGKMIVIREGYMGGTSIYLMPNDAKVSSRYRMDSNELCPVPRGYREILIGGNNEREEHGTDDEKETEPEPDKKAGEREPEKKHIRSISKTRKDCRTSGCVGRPRKLPVVAHAAKNND